MLVEALIDGKLSESDLVAAQKALESGDRSHDHRLLQGLRRSNGISAPALFPDLDSLYALIDNDNDAGDTD